LTCSLSGKYAMRVTAPVSKEDPLLPGRRIRAKVLRTNQTNLIEAEFVGTADLPVDQQR